MPDEQQNNEQNNEQGSSATEQQQSNEQQTNEQQQQQSNVPHEVARALKKANKEAETLRLKLREFEDRDKTDLQKITERAEAAEKAVSAAQSRALRYEVASEKGLTVKQALRLIGTTREELEADADDLVADLAPQQQRADFDAGARQQSSTATNDMNTALRRAAGRA